jgi:predicted nucleic acid-binding protein
MEKATVYVETTIPSYLVAEPSSDVVVAGHQRTTHDWWQTAASRFDLVISDVVYEELARGDPEIASRRVDIVSDLAILVSDSEVEKLAKQYVSELGLAGRALNDIPHVAFAVAYEIDYLVTWNCAHLANAMLLRKLREVNARLGLWLPTICTPEELMADPQE